MARRTSLFVVRHAQALPRSDWDGPDGDRPLSKRGHKQAWELTRWLALTHPSRVVSSPAMRCVETVTPLAAKSDLSVELDARLVEAGPSDELDDPDIAMRLAGRAEKVIGECLDIDKTLVVCSHGDVIPCWLELVRVRDGVNVIPARCAKGSVWELSWDGRRFVKAQYHKPSA